MQLGRLTGANRPIAVFCNLAPFGRPRRVHGCIDEPPEEKIKIGWEILSLAVF
jgi:hypothetical protein